ncbi:MAG: hypothetical protein AABY22_15325 [Nanoarchaeota archaeon]
MSYQNFCWNCGQEVDSDLCELCFTCYWLMCNNCDSCRCGMDNLLEEE